MSAAVQYRELELNKTVATALIASVRETLTSMSGQITHADEFRIEMNPSIHADISGIVSLAQDRLDGVLIVSFPKETIFRILAAIYQQQFADLDRSVQESVGEFTNIIYCGVKASLNSIGFKYRMAIPNVIIGDQHKVVNSGREPALVVPFSISGYLFHVIIQIQRSK